MAESKTAVATSSIELTYGRDMYGSADHLRAVVLTYSDVQKYFKLLRRHGYPCRYFVVGEYGKEKGRAHWHLIVYWLERVPPFAGYNQYGDWSDNWEKNRFMHRRLDENGQSVMIDGEPAYWWPHGWTFVEPVSFASVRYKMKYIQKDIGTMERQGHLSMSKKPPLGAEYFRLEAARYVEAGLAPQDLFYSFDEARDSRGKKIKFRLSAKSAELFLSEYVAAWQAYRPGRLLPESQLVQDFLDPQPDRRLDNFGNEIRFDWEKDAALEAKIADRLEQIEIAKNAWCVGGPHNLRIYIEKEWVNGFPKER